MFSKRLKTKGNTRTEIQQVTLQKTVLMNEKVLKYWLSASPELILWGVLLFTFKYDYWREDFAFIPMQSTWVMAILFTIRLRKIIINTITKWTKDGTR